MKTPVYAAVLCGTLLCMLCTACGAPKEYNTADLPLQSLEMHTDAEASLPFTLQTITLPVENGKPQQHIIVGDDVYFVLNHQKFTISSNDIELMFYDGESGTLKQLFAYQDDENGMNFAEFTAVGQYVYLLAYENEPYDADSKRNEHCEVWQIDTQTLQIRTVDTLEIDKSQYMRHALFATEEGDLCFSYSIHDRDSDDTKVTEKIYDPAADTWETVRIIAHEDGDFVANRDENFVCDTTSGRAVFSYGEEYILSTDTAKPLYKEGTAAYVNWAERCGTGDDKSYQFYHFDTESQQLYCTKADSLGYDVRPMGEYVMLWRDAGDTLGVFCLMLETGQLVQISPEGFSTGNLTDENGCFSFVMEDKRDDAPHLPMIAFIEPRQN